MDFIFPGGGIFSKIGEGSLLFFSQHSWKKTRNQIKKKTKLPPELDSISSRVHLEKLLGKYISTFSDLFILRNLRSMYGLVNPQWWQCRLLFSWNVIGYQFTPEISHHQFSLIMMICVWGTHFADNLKPKCLLINTSVAEINRSLFHMLTSFNTWIPQHRLWALLFQMRRTIMTWLTLTPKNPPKISRIDWIKFRISIITK